MPSVKEQVECAHKAALVVPQPDRAIVAVTGGDRASWLNGVVTCDVARLRAGEAAYGLAVTQKGRIVADLQVYVDEDRLLLVVPASAREDLLAAFERYLVMEDAELSAVPLRAFAVHGPASATVLERARAAGALGAALDLTGLGGALVLVPDDRADAVAAAMADAARAAGGAVGDDAGWESLRLERGVPRYGKDFDASTYPQEASLEKRAVSFDKGCYLGQEVVCMLEMRGHVKRKLVPVVLEGASPEAGAEVTDVAGAVVGKLTSVAAGATADQAVGLAMVKLASAQPGTELRVGAIAARVTLVQ